MSSSHQEASPGPGALSALAVVCFCFFALLTGRIPHEAAPALIGIGLGGGVIQIIAAVIDLKHGDLVGGTTFFVFGGFFMLATGINQAVHFTAALSGAHISPAMDGWFFLALAIILCLLTPSFATVTSIFFAALLFADVGVLILGLVNLNLVGHALMPVGAWFILIVGIIGLYLVLAQVYNTAVGKIIFPMGSPLIKKYSPPPTSDIKG